MEDPNKSPFRKGLFRTSPRPCFRTLQQLMCCRGELCISTVRDEHPEHLLCTGPSQSCAGEQLQDQWDALLTSLSLCFKAFVLWVGDTHLDFLMGLLCDAGCQGVVLIAALVHWSIPKAVCVCLMFAESWVVQARECVCKEFGKLCSGCMMVSEVNNKRLILSKCKDLVEGLHFLTSETHFFLSLAEGGCLDSDKSYHVFKLLRHWKLLSPAFRLQLSVALAWSGFYTCYCSQCPLILRRSLKWHAIIFEVWISWCQCRYVVKYSWVWRCLIINDWDLGHFLNINAGSECWLLVVKLLSSYLHVFSPSPFLLIVHGEMLNT